jgi:hypothetical protein
LRPNEGFWSFCNTVCLGLPPATSSPEVVGRCDLPVGDDGAFRSALDSELLLVPPPPPKKDEKKGAAVCVGVAAECCMARSGFSNAAISFAVAALASRFYGSLNESL